MSSPIKLKYTLTRELYADLSKALGKKTSGLTVFGWGLLLWVLLTFPTRALLQKAFSLEWPMGLQLLVAAAISGAVTLWMMSRASRKAQGSLAAEEDLEFYFSEAGIEKRSRLAETKQEWQACSKYLETEDYIFLCYPNQTIDVVPKKAFSDPADLAAFKELVSRKLKSDAGDPHPLWGRTRKWFVFALLIVIALMMLYARHFIGKPPGR
jgi:hypothetical protein